jgi:hypothetical protein
MSSHRFTSAAVAAVLLFAATTAFAQVTPDSAAAPAPAPAPAVAPEVPAPAPAPAVLPATPPAPITPSSILGPNSPAPSRPHLALPRGETTIRMERDQMALLFNSADNELLEAKKRQVEARGTVEIKKREIDTINARIKAAKQAKDEPTRVAFDGERKRQESMREFFTHVVEVWDAAIDEAQARSEFGHAAVRALDLETQLMGRGGVASFDSDPGVFKLEQQYFEASRQRGAAEEKYANRMQTLSDRRLRLYKAWADYLGGK